MRVVLAPDSFKGTAPAADAAAALADGWREVDPSAELLIRAMADGGEGTLDALAEAPGARAVPVTVDGPDSRPVDARWLDLGHGTALVELAECSGITLLDALAPLDAHTRGLGQAMAAALDAGARRLLVAVGGSASTDGGAGALGALGVRLLDEAGRDIAPGARGLETLDRIDLAGLRPLPPGGVTVLSDVTNPLLGANGAAAVYGPQKGADPFDVRRMDRALARLADALRAGGVEVLPQAPGTGAAGGTSFGLAAWGATVSSGARAVAGAIGLDAALADADLVVTGEGRFDGQSGAGKVTSEVLRLARRRGVPVALVAGAIEAPAEEFSAAVSLTDLAGSAAAAMGDPLAWLRAAGARLARDQASAC